MIPTHPRAAPLPRPVVVALRGGEAGLDVAYAVRAGVGGIGQTPGVGHVGEGSQALIPQTKGRFGVSTKDSFLRATTTLENQQ